ncbi:EscI/YscI/HrpB family type III secretion system inner rod protein [Vibrio cholerae]|uniref:EscI/YscI/HrpB family type III secretion system inner rod protein n=1 Tax=Vibrio cholerae TaxID=666 RepID=UPI00301926C4
MFDLDIQGIYETQPSIIEKIYNSVGDSFEQILATIDSIQSSGGGMSAVDTLRLQQEVFHYAVYQETVSKIAAKAANATNEVMKAQ